MKKISKKQWNIMTEFTVGFGYLILYLSIICIIFLMIRDVMGTWPTINNLVYYKYSLPQGVVWLYHQYTHCQGKNYVIRTCYYLHYRTSSHILYESEKMNKGFSIIRLYRNLDKWKSLHHKQILYKYRLKYRYNRLMEDYKDILVKHQQLKIENNELKRGKRNSW